MSREGAEGGAAARFPFAACLLAGGEGRRLGGRDKQLLPGPDGGPLGPGLARRLLEAFDEVLVVGRDPAPYAGLPLRASGDILPGFGILSGLHAGLASCRADWLYLAACDMPAFLPAWVGLLEAKLSAATAAAGSPGRRGGAPGDGAESRGPRTAPLAVMAAYGSHVEPFQALYSRALLPRLEAILAAPGAREGRRPSVRELFAPGELLLASEEEVLRLSPDRGLFFNINRPEELAAWEALRAAPARE